MRFQIVSLHNVAAIFFLLGSTQALAQLEPVAPAATGYKSEARTIMDMQLNATGPTTSTSGAEATEIYKRYLSDIGKQPKPSQSSSSTSGAVAPVSSGGGN